MSITMNDNCLCCETNLATVTFKPCGHRLVCTECLSKLPTPLQCPFRCSVTGTDDNCVITLEDAMQQYNDTRESHPFAGLSDNEECPLTWEEYNAIKLQVEEARAGRLEPKELKKKLEGTLTVHQYRFLYAVLYKDQDLHGVLKMCDKRRYDMVFITQKTCSLFMHTFLSTSLKASAGRAFLTAGVDLLVEGTVFGFAGAAARSVANHFLLGLPNIGMFVIYSGARIFKYLRSGRKDGKECLKDIGEHFAGCVAGAGGNALGSYAGAAIGGAIGTAICPGAGTFLGGTIGAVIGSLWLGIAFDTTGRLVYREFIPAKRRLKADELLREAAKACSIVLSAHNFEEARKRFHNKVLDIHPDKHPDASEEQKTKLTAEMQDLLASWQIVREHYSTKSDFDNDGETSIKICILKALDAVTKQWKAVRVYFPQFGFGREPNPETEKIETMTLYT